MTPPLCSRCGRVMREGFAPSRRGGGSFFFVCGGCVVDRARSDAEFRERVLLGGVV